MSQPFYSIEMNTKNIISKAFLYGSIFAFISFAIYILYINKEVLYTAHERSVFLFGAPFFNTLLSKPFGLIQYVGAWLTQLFYKPEIGASILLAIWALIFFVGIKAFRLQRNAIALMLLPIACLLTSVVDLGYWIYIFTVRGYWFSQSIGYLIMLLLLWVARNTPRKWHLAWYILAFCIYPILGWFALLFVLCLIVIEKPTWREFAGLLLLFITANLWRTFIYSDLKVEHVTLAGMPRFETPSDSSIFLTIPFWALGATSILITLSHRYISKAFIPAICAIIGICFTYSFMFKDKNYIDEMRMVRYAQDDNWKEVLDVVADNPKPTVSMVMLKNTALMNDGGLLDRSFKTTNDGAVIYNPDSVHVSFLEIAAPVVYYNYGLINEAIRLNYECAVQSGFSPFYLKMLSRCVLATGEKNLEKRFETLLHHHPYYEEWQPAPVSERVKELAQSYQDELTGVENTDSYLVNSVSLWYETESKEASEQALFYSMLRRDSRRFWASLRKYVKLHPNVEFPLHAQEAYIMYMDKAPEEKRMMLPVSQTTYDRYQQFWNTLEMMLQSGLKQDEIPEKMRGEFGDTYWYFNIFGRKIY